MKRKNMMGRNLAQTIRHSLGRYIAIVAIVALGAGLFCGLRVTKVDMVATVQRYTDGQNMFDLQVLNTYGWTEEDVQALSRAPGIADAEGSISLDALLHFSGQDDHAYRLLSLPEKVNRITLTAGRMPQAPDECLADSFYFSEAVIGKTIHVSSANSSGTLEHLSADGYTIVGLAATPLYLNMQRGSTTIGSGSVKGFLYLPREGFALAYYTQIDLTFRDEYEIYTPAFNDAMEDMADALEPSARAQAQLRYDSILADAEERYAEGYGEYLDGAAQYREGKAEARQELREALSALDEGRTELEKNRQNLEYGRQTILDAQATLDENRRLLIRSKAELAAAKTDAYAQMDAARAELDKNYALIAPSKAQVDEGLALLDDGIAQIEDGIAQLDGGIAQIDDGLAQIENGIAQLEDAIAQIDDGLAQLDEGLPQLDSAIETLQTLISLMEALSLGDSEAAVELKTQLQELQTQLDGYLLQQSELIVQRETCQTQLSGLQSQHQQLTTQRQELTAQREELLVQHQALEAQRQELLPTKAELDQAMALIQDGYTQLSDSRAQADREFADAQAQIDRGEAQLNEAQTLLDQQRQTLAEGEEALAEGALELQKGWKEYYDGRRQSESEFANAEHELRRGLAELKDAREEIDALTRPTLYTLTRNTNLGYVVFENDSDIVAGIAKIFPVFFLAVAALVCVTTMTRMIDEERTQIGILKALGYSRQAIMGKYLAYSGTASVLGCLLGLLLGSTLFPLVIWQAYCIMYDIPRSLVLSYDLWTILFIFLSYTGLTLLVTWYCCRRELAEVPAELIRPKPPVSGKQIFLERLPVWKRLKFLSKVAIRNIFRYRQRLAMMLLGIGGCTALLVTGFGLKDSISNIVSYQFEQVTLYDIGVTFSDPLDQAEQEAFLAANPEQQILFCHQGGIDLEFDGSVKNVYFIASDRDLEGFIDLHTGEQSLAMPAANEALISIGVAQAMGIRVGDTVTLRNADLDELTVTVSGIYDNHVNNFAIVSGDTLRAQWSREPELQTAYVLASPDQELQELGAQLADSESVLSMTINQSTANTVGSMMDALDSVIILVVICAGALAGIVLYNLTNINIQERIREIATIKVLGFNAGETASYVFKENLTLTVVGTLLGLAAGKALHALVMSCVRIDMVWFDNRIDPESYVLSGVLTILAALIVDLVMYFRLDRINMAEALKSVE